MLRRRLWRRSKRRSGKRKLLTADNPAWRPTQAIEVAIKQHGRAQRQSDHQHLTPIFADTENQIRGEELPAQNDVCRVDDRGEKSEHENQQDEDGADFPVFRTASYQAVDQSAGGQSAYHQPLQKFAEVVRS